MRLYTIQHKFYGGIALHVDWMAVCVLHAEGEVYLHQNSRTNPKAFLQALPPCREAVVVGVECMFTWDLTRGSLRGRGNSLGPGPCP